MPSVTSARDRIRSLPTGDTAPTSAEPTTLLEDNRVFAPPWWHTPNRWDRTDTRPPARPQSGSPERSGSG